MGRGSLETAVRSKRSLIPAALALSAVLAAGARVDGGSDREARAKAAALVRRGNAQFDAKRFKDALTSYQDAERIFPSKKIEFNLAETHRQLGHFAVAEMLFERFLEDPGSSTAKFRQGAEARLEDMRQHAGRVAIDGAVETAKIAVDGGGAFLLPAHPILVLPGKHKLVIMQSGREAYEASVDVKRGAVTTITIESPASSAPEVTALAAEADAEPKEAPPLAPLQVEAAEPRVALEVRAVEPSADEEPAITERWWFWAGAAAAVVAGAAAIVVVRSHGGASEPPAGLGSTHFSGWQRY